MSTGVGIALTILMWKVMELNGMMPFQQLLEVRGH